MNDSQDFKGLEEVLATELVALVPIMCNFNAVQ